MNSEDTEVQALIIKLLDLMTLLRSKENGCPWDKKQTHNSIRNNLLEESYEVIDAIEKEDFCALKEELGDLLLQIIFHSQMAKENNHFSFKDILINLQEKLITRHPHVFGDLKATSPKEALQTWNNAKDKERNTNINTSYINDIPKNLPALQLAQKIQSKASKAGFDWPNYLGALEKIDEELEELKRAININNDSAIKDEIGDLLFSVVNLSRFFSLSSEETLRDTINKFIRRFHQVELLAKNQHLALSEMPIEELESLWQEAKKQLN